MRRAIVVAVTLGLLAGAAVGPADAKKKKKKKTPVTFEAEGSLLTANPGDLNGVGITRQEFLATCGAPVTQGLDGFVIELDDSISAVTSEVQVTGTDASGMHDLDLYFFDESCGFQGEASTDAADETGVMVPGVRYVLVTAFFGTNIDFTLEAKELR